MVDAPGPQGHSEDWSEPKAARWGGQAGAGKALRKDSGIQGVPLKVLGRPILKSWVDPREVTIQWALVAKESK